MGASLACFLATCQPQVLPALNPFPSIYTQFILLVIVTLLEHMPHFLITLFGTLLTRHSFFPYPAFPRWPRTRNVGLSVSSCVAPL